MAAAEIQVANPANLAKIESFLNDPSYKETIESSSTFNSRLCAERRMRMPFIDTQTGVAQSHCHLFMTKKQRMPPLREGQVYTYPAQRWRKTRRQYLMTGSSRWGWVGAPDRTDVPAEGENSSGVPGESIGGEDSRDGSQTAAKDDPKEWFYDDLAMDELETGEEPDPESDEDYFVDSYVNRVRRKRGVPASGPGSRGGRVRRSAAADDTPGKRRGAGRGRKRAGPGSTLPYECAGDAEKPFGCELCGAKYKTRAGLIYHFNHTHKDSANATPGGGASDGDSRDSKGGGTPTPPVPLNPATEYQDSYVTFLNKPPLVTASGTATVPVGTVPAPVGVAPPGPAPPVRRSPPPPRPASADTSSSDSAPAPPAPSVVPAPAVAAAAAAASDSKEATASGKPPISPYCDFCLGDDRENKKTGTPEELVSCSDCGRSGHPTCLQFTANMIVSVRKYRWQCIECKCCSVCGRSDNDHQLLFCDDCDRGYHMYCLSPPLDTPPEGSWSCALCIVEFHKK